MSWHLQHTRENSPSYAFCRYKKGTMISHTSAIVFWFLVSILRENNICIALQIPLKKSGAGRTGLLQSIVKDSTQWVLIHDWVISQHLIILSEWKVNKCKPFVYKNIFLGFEINETTNSTYTLCNQYLGLFFLWNQWLICCMWKNGGVIFISILFIWLCFLSLFVCPRGNIFQINGLAY